MLCEDYVFLESLSFVGQPDYISFVYTCFVKLSGFVGEQFVFMIAYSLLHCLNYFVQGCNWFLD